MDSLTRIFAVANSDDLRLVRYHGARLGRARNLVRPLVGCKRPALRRRCRAACTHCARSEAPLRCAWDS